MLRGKFALIRYSLHHFGLAKTALSILRYPFNGKRRAERERREAEFAQLFLDNAPSEEKFTWIYKNSAWSAKETVSGSGSTLEYTQKLRNELGILVNNFSISSIFDAPCGDFNWMKHFLSEVTMEYIGGDIVQPLVDSLNAQYGNKRTTFIHIDLTKDKFPKTDLMICRDCLFHLSVQDTKAVLLNFTESDIPYLLTTSHDNSDGFRNQDIQTGDFRRIDLLSSPYNFPAPQLRIEDWIPPHEQRWMCLWTKGQIAEALARSSTKQLL